jgi:hypothetical protein
MRELSRSRRRSSERGRPSLLSPTSLTQKASLTSIASLLDFVAKNIVQFLINPLLVGGLGSFLYGVWRVLFSLNGYLWAASGRSAQALTWVVAHHQQSLTDEEKREHVASAVIVWCLFLPLLVLVGGLGAWFAPYLLEAPTELVWEIRGAAGFLAADAIALTLLSIPRSALAGENLGYKRMGLSTALIVLAGGLMALAIYFDTGITGVAVANAIGTVVTGLLFLRVAKKYLPWFGLAKPSRRNVRWFLGLSGWFTGWKLVYELMTAGDVIALGIFGSAELVTVYTLTKFVSQSLIPLIGVVFEGASPGLGALIGSGETRRGIHVRNEIMSFTWLTCTVLGSSLLLWNRSLVGLWVGERFYAGALPMLLIVVMVMQFTFLGNDARFIDLTLNVRSKVLLGAVSAFLSVGLAAMLIVTTENKIVGMCVGIILGRLLLSMAYPWLIGRMLDYPWGIQMRSLPRPALVTATLFGFALWVGEGLSARTWTGLVSSGIGTALLLTAVAAGLGLSRSQRRALSRRVRGIIRRGGSLRAESVESDD